ncbi:reticulon-3 isoform X3 [Archocentrus centrarchus]|uniref:reticulon-3 isoform X3 n=1 Tax=Archocentrus centrarchus TaxID=63155 RepID=UPI0011EA0DD7|nr:reticulon-3 isoform X3 [Archocentrus centrarchus]
MDPVTQSAQISSSQGFADGHSSAAKESKLSDSFLSSSPVSLIQSPQDKRTGFGSDKPCEGVATSLRFPSKPGSFSPGNYGSEAGPPDGPPDSPIKTSPVSERIKALEALAAKKTQPDFRSDGGFSHFRDRHHEKPTETSKSPVENQKSPIEIQKPPNEKTTPTTQKMGGSAEQESPESPFEVLGDLRQLNEFEETEEWMKAHLPPVPDFSSVDLTEGTNNVAPKGKETPIVIPASFTGVPDAFVDSPVEAPLAKDEFGDTRKQPSVEEEFDLNFLPTAYMWDQQEKSGDQPPSNLDSVIASPPAGFGTPSPPLTPTAGAQPKQNAADEEKAFPTGDRELPEASEADSSGESDDTVIEDDAGAPTSAPRPSFDPQVSKDPTTTSASADFPTAEKETPPPKSERKLMQVPTINVIETDEPNYSDDEMELEPEAEDEDYEVEKQAPSEAPETSQSEPEDSKSEQPKTRPLETEFMEGYSPPSSPVDSDSEYSPKHKILKSVPEMVNQESAAKPETLAKTTDSRDSASGISQAQPDKAQTTSNKVNEEPSQFTLPNEEVDFPDNDDEWSDEAQEILVKDYSTDLISKEPAPYTQPKLYEKGEKTVPLSKTTFMHDDIYDRQSFDYDYDASFPLDDIDHKGLSNAKERFLSDPSQSDTEMLNDIPEDRQSLDGVTSLNDGASSEQAGQPSLREDPPNPYSFPSEAQSGFSEPELNKKSSDTVGDESSLSEPTDSFVEFMRECLKSRQDEEPDNVHQGVHVKRELNQTGLPPSQSPPITVMDLEQEQLTISALKELCSSQEEEEEAAVNVQSKASDCDQTDLNSASAQQSSLTSATNPPCFQHNRALDSTYSKEVEAIDEWVAEAYHLAEHVLTAILTHLSAKDLVHWRDPKKSGVVFGLSMLLLLSLAAFSIISVVSYLLLALLCVTITFRIYKSVVQAVQKSNDGHPFKALIDKDVSIPPETFRKHVDASLAYINRALKQMSRLFLVEDLVDSLKLAVVMWLLTYVGAVFNGITILILGDILLFTVPPIYEKNKTQIDQYIDVVRTQVNTTIAKLQEKLPGAMKRSKTE